MANNYDEQTQENILTRLLESSRTDVDKRQGGITYDLLSPMSIELAFLYMELANVLDFGFADTTYGEFLDRRCNEMGIFRKDSTKSNGIATFTGEEGTLIPSGTEIATNGDEPIYFITDEDATIDADGSVDINVTALVGGLSGNIAPHKVSVVVGDLSSVVSVDNASIFDGGSDTESDEELLSRYYTRMQTPATSGNKFQYEQWALSVSGVGAVKVYPLNRGNGTVDVVLLDTEMTSTDATITDNVATFIESVRPIGADVLVRGATEVPINISTTLTLESGVSLEDAKNDIANSVKEYLKTLAYNDAVVRYTQIGTIILNSPYVVDYSNLQINGGTTNILINDGDVAVVGTVNA